QPLLEPHAPQYRQHGGPHHPLHQGWPARHLPASPSPPTTGTASTPPALVGGVKSLGEGSGFAAAVTRGGRAGYGAVPPVKGVLRIALARAGLRPPVATGASLSSHATARARQAGTSLSSQAKQTGRRFGSQPIGPPSTLRTPPQRIQKQLGGYFAFMTSGATP